MIETQKPLFTIKKVSVGVMIDGRYKEIKDKDGNIIKQFEPRSQQELQSYENLIKSAIGFDPNRGDQVTVISVPFEATSAQEEVSTRQQNLIMYAIAGILLLLILGLLAFIFIKKKKQKKEEIITATTLSAPLAGVAAEALAKKYEEEKSLVSEIEKLPEYLKILEIAEENPQMIANIITKWIKEDTKK
jgi:Flagellar biosynthesis/type III secretory pathway lipoprotein